MFDIVYFNRAIAKKRWRTQEKYPSCPIEFIVPWGPGGGADQVARKAGKIMEEDLKVAVTGFSSPDDITVNFFAARGLKLLSVPFANPGER